MRYSPLLIVPALFFAHPTYAIDTAPTSETDKLSYCLGAKTGETFKQQDISINSDQFVHGLNDAISGKQLALTEKQIQETISNFQNKQIAKLDARDKQLASKNLAKSKKFLAENKKDPKVTTLPSGLQYVVLSPGNGTSPKGTDLVTVNYRGTLLDGTEFDSSYSRNEPSTLPLQDLIPGWQEALVLMKPGAKWKIYVPPALAYGDKGAGRVIEPNSTLVFEIELLNVKSNTGKP